LKADIALGKKPESEGTKKLVLLSAHDSTIAQILITNGYMKPSCIIDYVMTGGIDSTETTTAKKILREHKDVSIESEETMNLNAGSEKNEPLNPADIPEDIRQEHEQWSKEHGGRPYWYNYVPEKYWPALDKKYLHPSTPSSTEPEAATEKTSTQ